MSAKLTETLALVGGVVPQSSTTAKNSDIVDFRHAQQVMFVLAVGSTDATVDFKLQAGNAANLSDAADISGKAITQLAATDDNKYAIIHLTRNEMVGLGKRYGRAVVTCGASGGTVAVIALADGLRYGDAPSFDLAAVAQVVG
ncbi:MAG: hypothetical protein SF123_25095 [Chloroflexota bacterium]|nr:hypothetical protein [Chloroflexota bacterium]